MRSGLSRRVAVASVVHAAVIAGAFLLLLAAIRDERDASREARSARAELALAGRLESTLLHLDDSARAFALSGAEQHRTHFTQLESELDRIVAELAATAQPVETERRVHHIVEVAIAYVETNARPLQVAPPASGEELAAALLAADERRAELEALIGEHVLAENRLMVQRQARSDAATRRGVMLASVGVAGSICLIVVFAALLVRWVLHPLRRASTMADRIARGDLTVRLATDGVGEIGQLERSFNAMVSSLADARRANAEALDDLQASRSRLVAAGDEARRRIERDLHDGIQQRLVSLSLRLRALEATSDPPTTTGLADASAELASTISDLQEVSRGIHPAILTQGGLVPALRTLARRSPVEVRFDVDEGRRLPEALEVALYYVASEALTNAAKHSRADSVQMQLRLRGAEAVLTVADDGRGGATAGTGSGLIGMADRVGAVGGSVSVDSSPGSGTRIVARIPHRG